ncbi:hypothetical protein ACFQU1_17730 [Chelatococcus sp. GCM10030263]|uniref:hypothetical protein n=1 Tax=Chelatococcus sp. GCM10030263 TaxID=3273387 RepID=UPI00362215A7
MEISNPIAPTQPITESRSSAEAGEFLQQIESVAQENEAAVQELQSTLGTVSMSFLQPIVMDILDLLNEEPEQ